MTLGVRSVVVTTSSGSTTTNYPIASLATDPGSVLNPTVGTTALRGAYAGTDTATWNSTYKYLDNSRPLWPALCIIDITSNPAANSGDWQQGGTAAIPPNAIYGTWKAAVKTVKQTTSPWTITVTPDADPASNNKWDGVMLLREASRVTPTRVTAPRFSG